MAEAMQGHRAYSSENVAGRRSALRSATWIAPKTGEQVRRVVTLREPNENERSLYHTASEGTSDAAGREPATVSTPLLGRRPSRVSHIARKRRMLHDKSTRSLQQLWGFWTSTTGIGILKASISYVLGSLATFVPVLSEFLGNSEGKHMTCTVTVYFHPARTVGSQLKAVTCAIAAFAYALFISFTSMAVSIFFDDYIKQLVLGHVFVLIVFCGGGLGFVGWVKQSLGDPLVNVGCSLTSLAIITVLTKEGAVQSADFSPFKIVQVFKMIVMGVGASTFVNMAIKPVFARKVLRQNLIDITDSLGDMLTGITRAFLTGSEDPENHSFRSASDRYKKIFATMTKTAKEARWEHYLLGTETQSKLEFRLVKSIEQMYHNLGGLRSAAATQFDLLKEPAAGNATPVAAGALRSPSTQDMESSAIEDFIAQQKSYDSLTAIAETFDEDDRNVLPDNFQDRSENETLPTARSPGEIFERFIIHLGPSMKSLAFTLKQILDDLPCTPGPEYIVKVDSHFYSSLIKAIDLYSAARKNALSSLYRSKDLAAKRPEAVEADFEEVAASCGHFSYSLLNFAEEMKTYLNVLDELRVVLDQPASKRSWNWVKFWHKQPAAKDVLPTANTETSNVYFQSPSPNGYEISGFGGNIQPTFKIERVPSRRDLPHRLWKASHFIRREDIKFAIKVGIGAALYALPSFVPAWRPVYTLWRGEWGLLSYMLVCSMTIGASDTTSVSRILGTLFGAFCSVVAWKFSHGNVFAMAFFGWIMALGNFYLIVAKGKGPLGRFIMLTYNLTALYAYAISVKPIEDDESEGGQNPRMFNIVLHRVVAVVSGCLWGMFVTRVVWPISARHKFRDGLSLLLLRMGLVWKRDPLAYFLEGESQHSYIDLKEELQLQRYLRQLEDICSAAGFEFHLKGPFPKAAYGRILQSVGRMLDAFHAMNVIITKDPIASQGETTLLKHTAPERAQLCQIISHLFQVLAASLKLRFPLNDALSNTNAARDRLLAKVFNFRKADNSQQLSTDEDYALLYAYALVTGQISSEIHEVAKEFEKLFGTLDDEHLQLK